MAKLRYIGHAHHRMIQGSDLSAKGLSDVNIDVWRGDIAEVPNDVADWLLSEYSLEANDWELRPDSDVVTLGTTPSTPPSAPPGEPMVDGLDSDNSNPNEPETPANEATKSKKK